MNEVVAQQPLVTVITPVFNGERYLEQCIESVIAQTYRNWEYVILDNASTDRTAEIVDRYARQDPRIRRVQNPATLPQIPNWNVSMRQMSPASRYCKVIHADDLLLPECIERMVDVGERHPSVSIVGAYRIDGATINMISIPFPEEFVDGRELCRKRLLGQWQDLFGSPTSILLRSDCVRARGDTFYGLDNPHADTEVCFELLKEGDYGFVHQVLTYTRRHTGAESSRVRATGSHAVGRIMIARDHGAAFLNPGEHRYAMDLQLGYYYDFLARNAGRLLDADFRGKTTALFESCGTRLRLRPLILRWLKYRVKSAFRGIAGPRAL